VSKNICFPAQCRQDAHILILGSYPGIRSLQEQRYYAHPRNDFWRIMAKILGFNISLAYDQRLYEVKKAGVALWDVLYTCSRPGSLDSSIKSSTIIVNDFAGFFKNYPGIRAIFFNGKRAENEFVKRVPPEIYNRHKQIYLKGLPSTSPAFASMSFEMKLTRWKTIEEYL